VPLSHTRTYIVFDGIRNIVGERGNGKHELLLPGNARRSLPFQTRPPVNEGVPFILVHRMTDANRRAAKPRLREDREKKIVPTWVAMNGRKPKAYLQ
jgi:hypothetical protein